MVRSRHSPTSPGLARLLGTARAAAADLLAGAFIAARPAVGGGLLVVRLAAVRHVTVAVAEARLAGVDDTDATSAVHRAHVRQCRTVVAHAATVVDVFRHAATPRRRPTAPATPTATPHAIRLRRARRDAPRLRSLVRRSNVVSSKCVLLIPATPACACARRPTTTISSAGGARSAIAAPAIRTVRAPDVCLSAFVAS
jgi:hypothetical protein